MNHLVSKMYSSPSYIDDLTVRMAYNSANIEGNTITIDETRLMLLDNIVPNFKRRVTLREIDEILNLRTAWDYMMQRADERITIGMMHELHNCVMQNIVHEAGEFKKTQNMVNGELTTPPEKTPTEILYLLDNLYSGSIAFAQTTKEKIRAAVAFHITYEKIHPYSDGNGRTGRLLLNHVLLFQGIAPFVIRGEDKDYYFRCLREYDEKGLTEYAMECINEEMELMN
jgi:Fic family protein